MQQQEEITLICPVHGQTTLTALFEECENNQTGCLKCRSIKWEMKDQTFKQLTTLLYTKKIKVLSELEKNCEQRLKIIYELFLNIKSQMNEHLENILNTITDQTKTITFNIKREYENIQEIPIPKIWDAEQQLKDYHLVKEKLKDKHFQNVQQMRDRVLREYYGFQEISMKKLAGFFYRICSPISHFHIKDFKFSQNIKICDQDANYNFLRKINVQWKSNKRAFLCPIERYISSIFVHNINSNHAISIRIPLKNSLILKNRTRRQCFKFLIQENKNPCLERRAENIHYPFYKTEKIIFDRFRNLK